MCFRYVPVNWRGDDESLNLLNQSVMEDVQTGGRAFLAGTDIRGRFALRSCALHYALSEDHVDAIVGAVRDAGSVRASAGPPLEELAAPQDAGLPALDWRAEDCECAG